MKTAVTVLAIAVLCICAWAADNAVVGIRPTAFRQSPVAGRQSLDAITIPHMLSYQGKLTNPSGLPVVDSTYGVDFGLYTLPSGGASFWNETESLLTRGGLFSVLLGSVSAIDSFPQAGTCYLGMKVGADPEMTPRIRLASAAYAFLARRADTANYAVAAAPTGTAGGDLTGTYPNPTVAKLQGRSVSASAPATNQVLKWDGSSWQPRNDSVGGGGTGDNAWVHGGDSVLYTIRQLGIARGGAGDTLYGNQAFTHVNLGSGSTTGAPGQDYQYCTVGGGSSNGASGYAATVAGGEGNSAHVLYGVVAGGDYNTASGSASTVSGGEDNVASGNFSSVAGGWYNSAIGNGSFVAAGSYDSAAGLRASVGGGLHNSASGSHSVVGGGAYNTSSQWYATVAGGDSNSASYDEATVSGGQGNVASGDHATVGGGQNNTASDMYGTIAGGVRNSASGNRSSVGGGEADTSAGDYSYTTNQYSKVPSDFSNSSAFNGQTATASNQTRVGVLSEALGTLTIDDPLDPSGKILNHYFVEGPEMLNMYRGSVVLDASGRAEVQLPDYFDALDRNPMMQLTGVGTSDVYVAEKVSGNRFVIGGKPGAEVYWTVTGERKDVSAEITRRMMPVEQPKTGSLAGRMLDDEFLSGCMEQLAREGKAQGIDFRTAAGRQRYEQMKRDSESKH
jgi:hypothetical protein